MVVSFLFIASTLLTAGCGSKYGARVTKVNYYPSCYQPIEDLRQAEEKLRKDMVTGAALGVITGLVVGLAVGGDAKSAAIGAGVGLVAGLAGSYLISKELQEKSLKERFEAYNSTIDNETHNLNVAVKYAKKSCDCYDTEYKKLNANYNKGGMSKEELLVRLKEIRDGNTEAINVLKVFKAESVKHTETYAQIYKNEQARKTDRPSKKALNQLNAKQKTYAKANKSADDTLNLIAYRNGIVEKQLSDRETASRGRNMLAMSKDPSPKILR
jgi:hypothetical protein